MAHELEIVNGKAKMVYAGAVPWHGLGKQISPDLTPDQVLAEAGLDWEVSKVPAFANIAGSLGAQNWWPFNSDRSESKGSFESTCACV
jgi:hypothetical protein